MVLDGWRCPACMRILAPAVVACPFCDGSEGGVTAPREPVTPGGPIHIHMETAGDEIARVVQSYVLQRARRSGLRGMRAV
jgi:hypothetical protein